MLLKGSTVSITGFIFPLLTHRITSSNPALVPCVAPNKLIPLKNRYLRSIVESYPVVAPVDTRVPPIFNKLSSWGKTVLPMCSYTISTPSLLVSSRTFRYQSGSRCGIKNLIYCACHFGDVFLVKWCDKRL